MENAKNELICIFFPKQQPVTLSQGVEHGVTNNHYCAEKQYINQHKANQDIQNIPCITKPLLGLCQLFFSFLCRCSGLFCCLLHSFLFKFFQSMILLKRKMRIPTAIYHIIIHPFLKKGKYYFQKTIKTPHFIVIRVSICCSCR